MQTKNLNIAKHFFNRQKEKDENKNHEKKKVKNKIIEPFFKCSSFSLEKVDDNYD